MIQEGRKAPAFNLPSSAGGKLALKDLAGKFVILYFYPRDNTPGCTTEANDFNKAYGVVGWSQRRSRRDVRDSSGRRNLARLC